MPAQPSPRRRFQFRLRRIPWWTCIKSSAVVGLFFGTGFWFFSDVAGIRSFRPNAV
jgi:hypothetical protein